MFWRSWNVHIEEYYEYLSFTAKFSPILTGLN